MRFILAVAVGLFLVAAPASSQDRFEAMGMGVVVDRDGQPAAGVEVRGLWQPTRGAPFGPSLVVAHTDAQGKFMVPLPVGEVQAIELLAYGGNDLAAYQERSVVSASQEIPEPVKLELKPYRPFHVQVKDQDGKPLAGVNVSSVPDFLGPCTQQTDANGEAKVIVINRFGPLAIAAWDPQLGLDYIHVNSPLGKEDKDRISHYFSDVVQLELHPWHQQKVRLVDLDKRPIANVVLIPNYFWPPDCHESISNCSLWSAVSDEDGIARLRYPESSKYLHFDIVAPGFRRDRIMLIEADFKDEIVLQSLMSVSGVITDANGQPAEGVRVKLLGDGPRIDTYLETAKTNSEGRFQAEVPEESYCAVMAMSKDSASRIEKRVVQRRHTVAPVELSLQPMLEVSGTSVGRDGKPMLDENIWYTRDGADLVAYFENLPDEQKLSPPMPAEKKLAFNFRQIGKTNFTGKFNDLLPPGNYTASVGVRGTVQSFTMKPEMPVELTLKNGMYPKDILKVRVVSAQQPDKLVAGTVVEYAAVGLTEKLREQHSNDLGCNYDNQGQAEFDVFDCPYVLTATSEDEKLQAFQYVPAGLLEVTLQVEPTVSIQGKLLRADGSLAAGQKIIADIDLQLGPEVICPLGQQMAVTNAEGQFTIDALHPGQKYNVHLADETEADEKINPAKPIFSYTPTPGDEKKDVGTFKLQPQENN